MQLRSDAFIRRRTKKRRREGSRRRFRLLIWRVSADYYLGCVVGAVGVGVVVLGAVVVVGVCGVSKHSKGCASVAERSDSVCSDFTKLYVHSSQGGVRLVLSL